MILTARNALKIINMISITVDIAWDIITDIATELLEKEQADEITEILDRKRKETLAQKRSFFVRMVSDPKIYNPAINKAGSTPRMSTDSYSPIVEGAPTIQTPRRYCAMCILIGSHCVLILIVGVANLANYLVSLFICHVYLFLLAKRNRAH